MLESLRDEGSRYLLLTKYDFWWLVDYEAFAAHLNAHYQRTEQTSQYALFHLE